MCQTGDQTGICRIHCLFASWPRPMPAVWYSHRGGVPEISEDKVKELRRRRVQLKKQQSSLALSLVGQPVILLSINSIYIIYKVEQSPALLVSVPTDLQAVKSQLRNKFTAIKSKWVWAYVCTPEEHCAGMSNAQSHHMYGNKRAWLCVPASQRETNTQGQWAGCTH